MSVLEMVSVLDIGVCIREVSVLDIGVCIREMSLLERCLH